MKFANLKTFSLHNLLLIIFLCATISGLMAQEKRYLEANYIKKEYRIEMRDGARLLTSVYSPRDTSESYPILIWRTPYNVGPYGEEKYTEYRRYAWEHFVKERYIIVFQDVRGRFMSEGNFVDMTPYLTKKKNNNDIDETTDTYDTVDWLVNNIPNNNGNVGLWGISYPGFYAAMGGIDAHPSVKAISPQAPIANWFGGDDWHHNGAFQLAEGFPFIYVFGIPREGLIEDWPDDFVFPTEDGYRFYLDLGPLKNVNEKYFKDKIPSWNDLMEHGTYDDFWKSRNSLPHFNNIKPAVLVVGGWFDAENLFGALETYQSIEEKNPVNNNFLVMGPWSHGGWVRTDGGSLGDVGFGSITRDYYIQNIELPFFNYYLKGKGKLELPEAYIFETGSNQWMKYNSWPPENTNQSSLYLNQNSSLTFDPPASEEVIYDEYISDPSKPVPFTMEVTTGVPKPYMTEDQRFAFQRPDVLSYETDVLTEDITVVGTVTVDFFVSTSGTDADWVVKLIDIFPSDSASTDRVVYSEYEMLVRGDILRGKFRESLENPKPFIPNEITNIKFDLNAIDHTFKKKHKIMVQVQSTWFPLFDLNPQKYCDIYNADESDFQKAVQRVYFSAKYPSRINFNTLK